MNDFVGSTGAIGNYGTYVSITLNRKAGNQTQKIFDIFKYKRYNILVDKLRYWKIYVYSGDRL